jgi:hypothetical protein
MLVIHKLFPPKPTLTEKDLPSLGCSIQLKPPAKLPEEVSPTSKTPQKTSLKPKTKAQNYLRYKERSSHYFSISVTYQPSNPLLRRSGSKPRGLTWYFSIPASWCHQLVPRQLKGTSWNGEPTLSAIFSCRNYWCLSWVMVYVIFVWFSWSFFPEE